MTGLAWKFPGASFANPLLPPLPAIANPRIWAYLGQSLARSQNVYGSDFATIGTGPVWPATGNYTTLTPGAAAIDTTKHDTTRDFTLCAVVRTAAVSGVTVIVSAQDATAAGDPDGWNATMALACSTGGGTLYGRSNGPGGGAAGVDLAIPTSLASWKFLSVRYGEGTGAPVMKLDGWTDAVHTYVTGTFPQNRLLVAQAYQIGNARRSFIQAGTQPFDIAFVAAWGEDTTDANMAAIYAHVRAYLANIRGGIVV